MFDIVCNETLSYAARLAKNKYNCFFVFSKNVIWEEKEI